MDILEKIEQLNLPDCIISTIDIIVDELIMKTNNWNDETEHGEPSLWLELPNDRHLEITHEENGIPEDKQYYSWRVHCSDDEFANDDFHSTMGVVDTQTMNKLDDNRKVRDMFVWALTVANTDIH